MLRLVTIQTDQQTYEYHMMRLNLKPDLMSSNIIFTAFWLFYLYNLTQLFQALTLSLVR